MNDENDGNSNPVTGDDEFMTITITNKEMIGMDKFFRPFLLLEFINCDGNGDGSLDEDEDGSWTR